MSVEVYIEDMIIRAINFKQNVLLREEKELKKISFDFKVSSEDYHDVTTLLYKQNFLVKVPEKSLEFPATIHHYFTSITDLYIKGNVGNFSLELIETK